MGDHFDSLLDLDTLSLKNSKNRFQTVDRSCNNKNATYDESDYEILSQVLSKSSINDTESDDVVFLGSNIVVKEEFDNRSSKSLKTIDQDMPRDMDAQHPSGWHLTNLKGGAKATLKVLGMKPGPKHATNDYQDSEPRINSINYRRRMDVDGPNIEPSFRSEQQRSIGTSNWIQSISYSPTILWEWFKTLACIIITSILIYHGLHFAQSIGKDIGSGIEKRRQSITENALICQKNYELNKCATDMVPAMDRQCKEWEICMLKNAALYEDSASVSAELYGGVINKFLSQFDVKSVAILTASILAFYIVSSWVRYAGLVSHGNGWFPGWMSRMPQNGTQLFPCAPMMPPPAPHPYFFPNYTLVGDYPYVNTKSSYSTDATDSSRYKDSYTNSRGSKKADVWKRRFISEWEDAQ
ncbi:bifunctional Brl1-Brr6 domain/Nucleus export protein Brl1-Brr6 [Babesia duncani]|uniref:Bifunctional Brl1-Brr6 domain/Nucleus export protein Brl1-Brr6 n=1 Tax=Babesia duncani TaxID=323732 RepID=A0AAD9UMZ4_9APIC|nr:bifunctional Brl1-Brr6 domain/Nucleus export protein Brl1-Brr6 [Babesia duncani]